MQHRTAAAVLAILIGASCTSSSQPPPVPSPSEGSARPPRGGEIVFGVLGEPVTLDPYSPVASDLTLALTRPLYPSLFRVQPDGSAVPELADSLSRMSGGSTRVTLRDANWSNGRPITADDVLATWRRAQLPSGLALASRASIEGNDIIFEGLGRVEKIALATRAPILPSGKVRAGVYGGPFVLADRTPGLQLIYEPNDEWLGEPPLLDRLIVQHIDSLEIMLALLEDGRLDAAAPPSTVNLEERLDETQLKFARDLGWESIRLDARGGAEVATGLFAALDRVALAEGLIRSDGRIANTPWPTPGDESVEGSWDLPDAAIDVSASMAVPRGDELLGLLQRALQLQLLDREVALDLIDIDVATFYGPWRDSNPASVSLMRVAGGPLGEAGEPGLDPAEVLPLFQVFSYLVWQEGVEGMRVNGTFEGPLWNAQEWSKP